MRGLLLRSQRIPNHHEGRGYQADVGVGWWGQFYDESRRRKMLTQIDDAALAKVLKPDNWNHYTIRCQGNRIQMWINGLQTVDYTETDKAIPKTGIIGVQIHGGPAGVAKYKEITIREL
jgi:hypothetical protein